MFVNWDSVVSIIYFYDGWFEFFPLGNVIRNGFDSVLLNSDDVVQISKPDDDKNQGNETYISEVIKVFFFFRNLKSDIWKKKRQIM